MHTTIKPSEDAIISCEICYQEVPVSEAKSEEAADYIIHYFGLECFDKWTHQVTLNLINR